MMIYLIGYLSNDEDAGKVYIATRHTSASLVM